MTYLYGFQDFSMIRLSFSNKDENVHRFVLRTIRGELLERERGRENKKKRKWERVIHTIWRGNNQGGRVGLTLKLVEFLWPSLTFEVILI